VTIMDYAMGSLGSSLRVGTRYLQEQLSAQGVQVTLSGGCLEDFVCNAHEAVTHTRKPGESHLSCLRRHLEGRARFILLWSGSDERFDREVWAKLISIAQKHAVPRWRKPAVNPAPSQHPLTRRATLPEYLVTKAVKQGRHRD